jgi:molybdopterin-biosynthesis enzyme MoeA-like protein
MGWGVVIVGDEILSGRRQDKHLEKAISLLNERGLSLSWARYVGDEPARLVPLYRECLEGDDIVFSFGGIGATPDDHTRHAVGQASGFPLELHPEAEALIRARFGEAITPERLNMGVFPVGSRIIENPYNQIPGFALRHLHCLPGFPAMSWPMMASVLDGDYALLHHQFDYVEASILIPDAYEGQLIDLMQEITYLFPEVTLFSLPTLPTETHGRRLELGTKGPAQAVAISMAHIRHSVKARGFSLEELSTLGPKPS